MMGNMLADELGEMYRQRSRWFVLLGGLLGGIIALSTAFGFWLENWGQHIGGGPGENAHAIAVGLAIALTVMVIVMILMVWRSRVLLSRANSIVPVQPTSVSRASAEVNAAVAAWTSAALSSAIGGSMHQSRTHGAQPGPINGTARRSGAGTTLESRLAPTTGTEFTVCSDSSGPTLAESIQSVTRAGIKADGLWSVPSPEGDHVHLVVRTVGDTEARLIGVGLKIVARQDVILVDFEEHPGAAADVFRRLSEAGVNVASAQLASSTCMVIVSNDPEGVIQALR